MINRADLLDAMKENKELEKLVYEFGSVDKAVAGMNVVSSAFESILKGIDNFVEEFKKGFNQSKENRLECFLCNKGCIETIYLDDEPESLAESFINDVNAAIDKYGEEVVFEEEFKRDEDLFQKALNMCDYDVVVRYNYLNQLLCELEDEQREIYEDIEKVKVEQEICEILITDYNFDVRNKLIKANRRYIELTKELNEVECRIEATTDLFDDTYCNIIKNLD